MSTTFIDWMHQWLEQNEANQPRIIDTMEDGIGIPYFEPESEIEMERRTR